MKNDNYTEQWKFLPLFLISIIGIAVFACAFYFPTTRDDFYYLRNFEIGVFEEYQYAYFGGNPRIGQFFTNLVMRSVYLKSIYAVVLFFGFFIMIFLNVFRKLPSPNSASDIYKLIGMMGIFSFFIYVFGEMFFYASFSGNYTLSVVFYLLFLFVISEYYIFDRNRLGNSIWTIPLVIFIGVYTGMCNEHVPPVLIGLSFLAAFIYFIKKKRLPDFRILLYQFTLIVGYLLLYFAPANTEKYRVLGKENEGFSLVSYFKNFVNVINYFRYFTLELCVIFVVCLGVIAYLFFKKKISRNQLLLAVFYASAGLLTIPVVSYAPLSGTRLLFFTNTMFFVVIFYTIYQLSSQQRIIRVSNVFGGLSIFVFLFSGIIIYKKATDNFELVTQEIQSATKKNSTVKLKSNFDYYHSDFGRFNRRFLLDRGNEYIDDNPSDDSSQEKILKTYFHVQSLSAKP